MEKDIVIEIVSAFVSCRDLLFTSKTKNIHPYVHIQFCAELVPGLELMLRDSFMC